MRTVFRELLVVVAFSVVAAALASCAPQSVATTPTDQSGAAPRSTPGKPLRIGLNKEPSELGSKFGGGGTGIADFAFLFAAKMVHYDQLGNPVPVLTQEITRKIFDDGRMETTYRLRDTTWHDGTPLTADDVVFTWKAIVDPQLPAENREPEKFVDAIEPLDGRSFVVRWNETFIFANAWNIEPLPRHILEPLVQRDAQAFSNSAYWTREWVGLGPYKVADWVTGSHVKGQANTSFTLGEPRIQEIYVHFVSDANQATAQMLAGALDVTLGNLLRVEEGLTVREQMEPRGEGWIMAIPTKHRYGEFQYREPQPPPSRDTRVRQGMVHALDRELLVESLLFGLTRPADMYLAPNDVVFANAQFASILMI
jgi:peptide/nickel transport system substrate-binding protein